MSYFNLASHAKKIISIVLLLIICISTVTYAVIDIDKIYTEIMSNDRYITNLHQAGETLNMSNAEVDTIIKNYVTYIMEESESDVANGTMTSVNYKDEIKAKCFNKTNTSHLDTLLNIAYPNWLIAFATGNVPPDMKPMYDTLKIEVPAQLGFGPSPSPSVAPTQTKTPSDTGTGAGNGSSGGTTTPIVTPVLPPVIAKTFNDLESVQWAETAINALAEVGVISKNDEMKFNPLNNVKREEFVKLIVSGFNLKNPDATSDFADVEKDSWYYPYLSSMAKLNLVKGYEDNSFGVGQDITRQDIAVLLYRVIQHIGIDAVPSEPIFFNDDAQISDYAKDSVYMMRQVGIIKGTPENAFEPKNFATRAEAAQMIYNTYKIYIAKK